MFVLISVHNDLESLACSRQASRIASQSPGTFSRFRDRHFASRPKSRDRVAEVARAAAMLTFDIQIGELRDGRHVKKLPWIDDPRDLPTRSGGQVIVLVQPELLTGERLFCNPPRGSLVWQRLDEETVLMCR